MFDVNEIEIRAEDGLVGRRILGALGLVLHELRTLRNEVRTLATNDAALTQVVSDLAQAYADDYTALEAQIAALTAAQQNDDDAAEDAAVTGLQTLVATMKTNTAAANAAVAALNPPPAAAAPAAGDGSTATS